ncbi:M14 metallopeptidase family protein [Horticoccus sp. 23ND18S-11]|uniref:M14 metallopeptidase family protein n=1 Tax=Horticoccus sp. 23ND18S-11 TaxID=3391832 RepID=UPI0039C9E0FD
MHFRLLFCLCVLLAFFSTPAAAKITSPQEHFGFAIGDDFHLATYTQTEAYFKKLAVESDRVRLVDMGKTEEGRTQWMVIVTAPENLKSLARYQEISRTLARAEGVSETAARALADEGKAIVWIDGGLHASETVGAHQLIETVWLLASATDAEITRILKDVIVLCAHANPDGQELVSSWYMREPDPTKRVLTATPRLYHKYIGHDNNRDFYMSAMKETTNINRQLYLEWFPQIVYNHHQSGPIGTVIFVPPFRDPFNFVYDPLVVNGVQALGTAIQGRLLQEDKPGSTSRSGANYSTWFNGSLRTTSYFHNMIGLLTEIIGNPTPMRIPLVARRQLPTNDLPAPVPPQLWHFRQSIDYSLSANRAVLDYARRQREELLYNIYRMGRNAIERGNRDHWTPQPSRIDEIVRLAANDRAGADTDDSTPDAAEPSPRAGTTRRLALKYWDLLRKPEWRDPRGYIVPADQPDFPTAVTFINTLTKAGIAVHRATAEFSVAGKKYPAGSYVVKTAQAFRPHVLDMFEPQDHPNDFRYEGGPPNRPYDVAGWTLAFQMGVKFDRVLEAFDGPFERLPYGKQQPPPPGRIERTPNTPVGFLVSHQVNHTAVLTNRLLKAGAEAYWLPSPPPALAHLGPGALYVPLRPGVRAILETAATQLGLDFHPLVEAPAATGLIRLQPMRIALWDRFGGSMPSGWTRWLLEQFEFPFDVVYPNQIDAGRLREKYDAIIFVSGAIPAPGVRPPPENRPRNLPPEFEGWMGRITPDKSVPALKEFLQAGGTVVTIGSSTQLAYHLGLPVQSALTERSPEGRLRTLPDEKFYIPGSILEGKVDTAQPLAWGMPAKADFYFERSAAFTLPANSTDAGLTPVVWYDSATPLRSGWALGQSYLKDRVAIATANVGAGKLHLMGSEVAFRGQTHGTFKFLFNALFLATAKTDSP